MILTNRLFKREPPSRDAKSIYIFCEGAKRERQYFDYFKEKDSRINIEVYSLDSHEDNSPLGLLAIAKQSILPSKKNNHNPKYTFQENDEVWIVLDTDIDKSRSRKPQIIQIEEFCKQEMDWFIVQSNPCFEVWLYYHSSPKKPVFEGDTYCTAWKKMVNSSIGGGFDSRKHPIYIEKAIKHAEDNFESHDDAPSTGSTEVFELAKSIFPLVETKIKLVLSKARVRSNRKEPATNYKKTNA